MSLAACDDSELVNASLSGNRDAFGLIVSRYQSLICSLAYSATGSLGTSEDLAQETFITAWKHLRHLRERNKLKAWLCGIARNRINSSLRREGREPLRDAQSLEAVHESASAEPLPHDQTISKEEEAILWRSLERIPEIYREPLVLFYREHQSIEAVAVALDLTEDAVKQRLSRGRKLLAEEVAAFVEGALARTNPGRAFTIGVLASLPIVLTTSAKAATLGAIAAKGGMAAKTAVGVGLISSILSPLLGFLGPWIQYRMFMDSAKTDAERVGIKAHFRKMFGLTAGFGIALVVVIYAGKDFIPTHPVWFACALIGLVVAYLHAWIQFGIWLSGLGKKFQAEQTALGKNSTAHPGWEYRSQFELLGLPFIHIRFNNTGERRAPVKAWIAVGDCAMGLLLAFGGVAVAPVSVGGLAIGLIPWGGVAVGLFAIGGMAFGGWAFGGLAIGWQAFGGCALAWNAAMGGLSLAHDYALGGVAQAAQANNDIASQFIKGHPFFSRMQVFTRHVGWMNLFWLIPVFVWSRRLKNMAAKKNSDPQQ